MIILHVTIIVYAAIVAFVYFRGSREQFIGVSIMFLILSPMSYWMQKKRQLSRWQERLLASLVVFPILSFFIPMRDLLALFAGSIIAAIIIWLTDSGKKDVTKSEEDNHRGGN